MRIYCDVQITRRKRLHYIMDEHDEPKWTGARILDAFSWLLDNDQRQFWLEDKGKVFCVDLQTVVERARLPDATVTPKN